MLAARCKLDRRQAIIEIGVQPFPLAIPDVNAGSTTATIPIASYRALIDTGAQRTCLTNSTITKERLVRHGHKFIQNVHSEATHSLFMANIGIFAEDGLGDPLSEPSRTYFGIGDPVEVINIADNHGFEAILGMDVLERFSFRFGSGEFELTLR